MGKNSHGIDHRRQEVQQAVKNACDELNTAGVDARNYVEQLAWLFFLKAFDEAKSRREQEAVTCVQGFPTATPNRQNHAIFRRCQQSVRGHSQPAPGGALGDCRRAVVADFPVRHLGRGHVAGRHGGQPLATVPFAAGQGSCFYASAQAAPFHLVVVAIDAGARGPEAGIFLDWRTAASVSPANQRAS